MAQRPTTARCGGETPRVARQSVPSWEWLIPQVDCVHLIAKSVYRIGVLAKCSSSHHFSDDLKRPRRSDTEPANCKMGFQWIQFGTAACSRKFPNKGIGRSLQGRSMGCVRWKVRRRSGVSAISLRFTSAVVSGACSSVGIPFAKILDVSIAMGFPPTPTLTSARRR
jgi:hypothetical protein